jgi:hypothetical protein
LVRGKVVVCVVGDSKEGQGGMLPEAIGPFEAKKTSLSILEGRISKSVKEMFDTYGREMVTKTTMGHNVCLW